MKFLNLLHWVIVLLYEPYYLFRKQFTRLYKKENKPYEEINSHYALIEKKKWIYYKRLIRKYPEMTWVKKYLVSDRILCIKGIVAQMMSEKYNLSSIWTYEASFEDLLFILNIGLPVSSEIFLENGTPHTIAIKKYNKTIKQIVFADSLGHYNSNYLFHYNENCYMNKDKFIKANTGNEVFINFTLKNTNKIYQLVRNRLRKYKLYEIN